MLGYFQPNDSQTWRAKYSRLDEFSRCPKKHEKYLLFYGRRNQGLIFAAAREIAVQQTGRSGFETR
jgi:hypothetical protein